jgi:hypothetical protein
MIDKRLYIIVPEVLEIPGTNRGIIMSCGRLVAQAVHVGSKLKIQEKLAADLETTTIVLKVPHSTDLEFVLNKVKKSGLPWATFLDTNYEVYGITDSLLTSIACLASRKKGKSLFYGVESWKCSETNNE